MRVQRITRHCGVCDVGFELSPSRVARGEGVFCSKVCYLASRGVRPLETHICRVCGNTFSIWGSRVALGRGGSGNLEKAHRFAWEIENGPIPKGFYICHRCDNPPCVRQDHLFLGTPKENAADMIAKGRKAPWRRRSD